MGNLMKPLVSVLMPLLNAATTLPFALASLLAQSHEFLECVIVDDGSTDDPERIIERFDDPRFRYSRLDRNRGRGFARQRALEQAEGRYIAFLDADDWIYPAKLQLQLDLLASDSALSAVSTGMAISDLDGNMAGIRSAAPGDEVTTRAVTKPEVLPLAFAPTMIDAGLAKQTAFDESFPTSEDTDFLLRALLGKRYAVIPQPFYVYREQGAMTLDKVNQALDYSCRSFYKYSRQYPLQARAEAVKARTKQLIYHAADFAGMWDQIIARRSRTSSPLERQHYNDAWKTVSSIANQHVGDLLAAGA